MSALVFFHVHIDKPGPSCGLWGHSGAPIGERCSVSTCRIILIFVNREAHEKLVDIKSAPLLQVPG